MTTRPQDYKNNPEIDRRTRRSPEVAKLVETRLPEVDEAVESLERTFARRFQEFIPLKQVVEAPADVVLNETAEYSPPAQVEAETSERSEPEIAADSTDTSEQADRDKRIQAAQKEVAGA